MIPRRLGTRGYRGPALTPVTPGVAPKLNPDEERPFPLLGGVQHCFGRLPRAAAGGQSEIILTQENSFHPSVPEAEFGTAVSACGVTTVGLDSKCV